ncbi:MAG: hypothetical protein M3Q06_02460 [Bacteroidota bacterium]|nr:hypothetical protein [Bacteroidota bacterium]
MPGNCTNSSTITNADGNAIRNTPDPQLTNLTGTTRCAHPLSTELKRELPVFTQPGCLPVMVRSPM